LNLRKLQGFKLKIDVEPHIQVDYNIIPSQGVMAPWYGIATKAAFPEVLGTLH
jgi:hypothetical protein